MTAKRVSRAGLTLGFGSILEHALMFLRTVLVARLLGPEFFGISVTFLLVVSTFALISDLGLEKYVIQARDNELADTMPTLATLLLIRGLLMGLMILLLSGWIAAQFGHPELGWFYALAAMIPVIEGFRNLDPLAQQRRMQFGAYVKMLIGGLVPGVVLAVALAAVTHNYIAVAAGALTTSVVAVTLSHRLAREPYRLGLNRKAFTAVIGYGWPLLLNGIVIFFATQGDRIVIGTLAGMRDLAGYVAVAALTGGVSLFLAKLTGNLYFPLLSEARGNPELFGERCRTTGATSLLLVSAMVFPLAMVGAPLVVLLFGPDYQTPALLATFLAIQAAAMMLRSWCATISLTLGGTSDILAASILRIIGLGGALLALSSGKDIVWVAACMAGGDALATFLALWRVSQRTKAAAPSCRILGLVFTGLAALVIVGNVTFNPVTSWSGAIFSAAIAGVPGMFVALLMSSDLRERIKTMFIRLARKID
ncbi:O-antigen/teichoic acid export membrane protein [Porphyrobacter sp. MBR-155]|jgi:O-antigen/teichoic acid export membrane protein|uniref:oligosaccharide flippase family protein n=1 Tax=Porphyrobacter sp. MBR-155 TaxID=3156464 RepID=UPI003394EDF9